MGMHLAPNHQRFLSKHMGWDLVALPLISPQGLQKNAPTAIPAALLLLSPFTCELSIDSWCQELL